MSDPIPVFQPRLKVPDASRLRVGIGRLILWFIRAVPRIERPVETWKRTAGYRGDPLASNRSTSDNKKAS